MLLHIAHTRCMSLGHIDGSHDTAPPPERASRDIQTFGESTSIRAVSNQPVPQVTHKPWATVATAIAIFFSQLSMSFAPFCPTVGLQLNDCLRNDLCRTEDGLDAAVVKLSNGDRSVGTRQDGIEVTERLGFVPLTVAPKKSLWRANRNSLQPRLFIRL